MTSTDRDADVSETMEDSVRELSETEVRKIVQDELAEMDLTDLVPPTSRRNMLKAGGLGMAALAGGTAAAAPAAASEDEPPNGGVWRDIDDDGYLETPKQEGIQTRYRTQIDEASRSEQQIGRALTTTEERDLWVSPDGDDDNAGTPENPIRNLTEAMNRLPHIIQHDFTIHLEDGEYPELVRTPAGEQSINAIHSNVHLIHSPAHFDIIGNRDNPGNVSIGPGMNLSFWGKMEHFKILGVELNDLTQVAGSCVFWDCHLNGDDARAPNSTGRHAIGGYNPHVWLKNSRIGSPNEDEAVQYGVAATMSGARFQAEGCEINALEAATYVQNGAIGHLWFNDINAPELVEAEPGTLLVQGHDLYVGGQKITE